MGPQERMGTGFAAIACHPLCSNASWTGVQASSRTEKGDFRTKDRKGSKKVPFARQPAVAEPCAIKWSGALVEVVSCHFVTKPPLAIARYAPTCFIDRLEQSEFQIAIPSHGTVHILRPGLILMHLRVCLPA